MRRRRSGAAPDSPLAAVAADVLRATPPRPGPGCSPRVALEATWRLIREANAYLEANEPWKVDPGPEVDAVLGDALEVLRIVAILATPGDARHLRGDLAPHRPRRVGPPTSGCPRPRPGAATPAASPVEKGAPLFPRLAG